MMSLTPLPYFSTSCLDDLNDSVETNVARYLEGDFTTEILAPGACLDLPVRVDLSALSGLKSDGGASSDFENALLVWSALREMTPALACESRIWARLCHKEGLAYARGRWFSNLSGTELMAAIEKHMFAGTQTMWRDDNALGRLWWSAFIAHRSDPNDFQQALGLILKTADIRSNFVERTWMTTRRCVASAVIRCMKNDPWVTAKELNFRETMKALNVEGAGLAFEAMSPARIEFVVQRSVGRAQAAVSSHT